MSAKTKNEKWNEKNIYWTFCKKCKYNQKWFSASDRAFFTLSKVDMGENVIVKYFWICLFISKAVFFMRKLSAKKFEWSKDTNSFVLRAEDLKLTRSVVLFLMNVRNFSTKMIIKIFFCPPFEWCRYRWRITCPPRIYLTPLCLARSCAKSYLYYNVVVSHGPWIKNFMHDLNNYYSLSCIIKPFCYVS